MGSTDLRRKDVRQHRRRVVQPRLEGLEDRMLLYATNGGLWSYGSRITFSFVPDGTSIGGVSSNLFATLNATQSTASWQSQFLKAAAVWETYAGINLALVPDNGSPEGIAGNQQGDSRFGDIRIAMIPQNTGALAYTLLPPPYNGGTTAGDMVFNSNFSWDPNSGYDLETVALHEIGHALGMDHSAVTSAVMYAYYNGVKQSATSDDVRGIQTVYGAYPADNSPNRTITTATNISSQIDANSQIAIGNLFISGGNDANYFYVTAPANTTGSMTVSMQTTNLSSLTPKLAIYNSAKTGLAQNAMVNGFGSTAVITITGVSPGQGFYLRTAAAGSACGYGSYGLEVNFGSKTQAPVPPPYTVVASKPDQGGGSSNLGTQGPTIYPWTPGAPDLVNMPGLVNQVSTAFAASPSPSQTLDGQNAQGDDDSSQASPLVKIGDLSAYGEALLAADVVAVHPGSNRIGPASHVVAAESSRTIVVHLRKDGVTASHREIAASHPVAVAPWVGVPQTMNDAPSKTLGATTPGTSGVVHSRWHRQRSRQLV